MSRVRVRAHHIDGEWMTTGTHDTKASLAAIRAVITARECYCEFRLDDDHDCMFDPAEYKPYLSWMRVVPGCPAWCDEGHAWHWHTAKEGTRGATRTIDWIWVLS